MQELALQTPSYNSILSRTCDQLKSALAQADNPIVTTKFNPRTGVLLHLVATIQPHVPVVWVDTGYNTRDTLEFARYLQALLALDLRTFTPVDHEYISPPSTDSDEHAAFVQQVKLAPFSRAMESLKPDVWLSSLRRCQTAHRSKLRQTDVISAQLTKIYPLLDWSDDMMDRYLKEHGIAKGPHCYDPTKGEQKRECGLHTQRWSGTPEPLQLSA